MGSDPWFGINSLCCSVIVGSGLGAQREVRLYYRAVGRRGKREVGETLRRLNGQASELEVVGEVAD